MRHIAIVGSGPAGYYTAEAAVKQFGEDVHIDIIDRLPTPFGLIRFGVAPDHQSIKAVSRRYEKTALTENVRFVGNIAIGSDITLDELRTLYDAVVLAVGAPTDRSLGIAGEELTGVYGSAAFVGWYNGHPDFASLAPPLDCESVVIVGNGNVALDCARILAKQPAELADSDIVGHALRALESATVRRIVILGRRGPLQIAMTPKELGELAHLSRAVPRVDSDDFPPMADDALLEPGQRKSVTLLREFARNNGGHGMPIEIVFDFFAAPKRIVGESGMVKAIEVERTELVDGRAVGTGENYRIDCGMVISCIGYRSVPIAGAPFDERAGRYANDEGRILPGLYCVGWAKRGPTGTIGTNKPDGFDIIAAVAADIGRGSGKPGRKGLDALAAERGLDIVTFRDWKKIEEAEKAAARAGAPREKFVAVEDMIKARG